MKKSLSILFALMLGFPLAVFAQGTMKIGTVDMQRAFKEYNKTKEAEAKINDAKNAARKEYDDRAQDYKKALDEINNLNKQLESPALSADKKTQTAKDRDDKISKIKNMERVKANNLDLVFDKSGMSINGVPVVMYSHDNVDFTNDVITVLNKPGRATALTTKTSTSASATPARAAKP